MRKAVVDKVYINEKKGIYGFMGYIETDSERAKRMESKVCELLKKYYDLLARHSSLKLILKDMKSGKMGSDNWKIKAGFKINLFSCLPIWQFPVKLDKQVHIHRTKTLSDKNDV